MGAEFPSTGGGGGSPTGSAGGDLSGSTYPNPVLKPGVALVPTAVKTSAYSAIAGDFVPVDATSGTVAVTLPSAPADRTRLAVKKIDASANTVTVACGGTDHFNKAGGSTSVTITYTNQTMQLQYVSSTGIWYVVAGDLGLTALDSRYDALGAAAAAQAASQPLDSDLTAIAALATTAFGRSVLTQASAAALRTLAGTVIGTDVAAFGDARLSDTRTPTDATVTDAKIAAAGLTNAAIAAAAGIVKSKLAALAIVDADVSAISESKITNLVTDLAAKAPLSSPALTGTPTAPTAAVDTNTTQLATTAMVVAQAASATPLIDATSAVVGTSLRYARGDHVHPTDTTRAALASPTFTGTPSAPTAAANNNSTQLATTAYVDTASGLLVPKSLFTTKGDLAVASAGSTPARLAIGSDGQYLVADSTQATGAKWATPPTSGEWGPADYGYIAWAYDPGLTNTGSVLTSGLVLRIRLKVDFATSITNIILHVPTAGVTLTASQNLAGLYQGGVKLGSTADQSGTWNSTGLKTMALTGGPFAVTAGFVDIEVVSNGTTPVSLLRMFVGASAQFNQALSAANSRFSTGDAGTTTTLPATIGAQSALGTDYWGAIS